LTQANPNTYLKALWVVANKKRKSLINVNL
jgi:hypothetical protein